jgi:hypothetical protein
VTLAEWKRQFHVGQRLVCTYRWYWGKSADRPAPPGGREEITVTQIRTVGILYKTADKERVYLDFPRAHELKADENGFELYFPSEPKWLDRAGTLMSRYEWIKE